MTGLVGVGLRREWVSSTSVCVATFLADILDKVSVAGGNYVVSETLYFYILGM